MGASLRFNVVNRIEAGTLKNGTGSGAPALDEVAPYLMTNALRRDRRVLWQQASGTSMYVDVDLLANRTLGLVGIFGHRPVSGAAGIYDYDVLYSTAANGYPPVSSNPWTAVPGASNISVLAARDTGVVINNAGTAATIPARYLRFDLAVSAAFTVGKLLAGALDYDLGHLGSPGMTQTLLTPRSEPRSAGNDPLLTVIGDPRYLFTIPFESVAAAVRGSLDSLARVPDSFVMVDENDILREVFIPGAQLAVRHEWTSGASPLIGTGPTTNLFGAELNLEQLS